MVLKAKNDGSVKPLSNVADFQSWNAPRLNKGNAPFYSKPEEDEIIEQTNEEDTLQQDSVQSAYDKAYEEGFAQGLQDAQKQQDELASTLITLIEGLTEPTKLWNESTQKMLMELAFAIARQILRREVNQDPAQLIAIIRESIKLLPLGVSKIQIALHPEDCLVVKKALSIKPDDASNTTENGQDENASRWNITEDLSIERGSCRVETENSVVDASIDKQIAVLFSNLVGGQRAGE
ncbi:MAG: flagellar assembly protein FliH [Gammaproteobacteria bacterium]|nr:flagellar assembly protein FliH [Gammaproteobacteria bacterium]MDH5630078.1 flagellar assembly protein FliH [Gammaproteobacteria bacterium]